MAEVYIIPGGRGAAVSNSDKTLGGVNNPSSSGGITISGQGSPAKNTSRSSAKRGK